MPLDDEVRKALDTIFSGDAGFYRKRGWNQRSGFGTRPALLNIDLAQRLDPAGLPLLLRRHGRADHPRRAAPARRRPGQAPAHRLHHYRLLQPLRHGRLPAQETFWGPHAGHAEATEIDDRVALEEGIDTLIVKKRPSAFAGTHLGGILRAGGIDTLICTGVTMASCVRHTVEDALGEGFRTVVVRECVGDRVPAAIEWNLFDMDMKYCDVEPLERVLAYLAALEPFAEG